MARPVRLSEPIMIDTYPCVPDTIIVPCQWLDFWAEKHELGPEERLYFAVLEDALRTLQKGMAGPNGARRYYDAWAWIDNTAEIPAAITFESVCEVLDLDSSWFRAQIHRIHQNGAMTDFPRRSPARTCESIKPQTPRQRLSVDIRGPRKVCAV